MDKLSSFINQNSKYPIILGSSFNPDSENKKLLRYKFKPNSINDSSPSLIQRTDEDEVMITHTCQDILENPKKFKGSIQQSQKNNYVLSFNGSSFILDKINSTYTSLQQEPPEYPENENKTISLSSISLPFLPSSISQYKLKRRKELDVHSIDTDQIQSMSNTPQTQVATSNESEITTLKEDTSFITNQTNSAPADSHSQSTDSLHNKDTSIPLVISSTLNQSQTQSILATIDTNQPNLNPSVSPTLSDTKDLLSTNILPVSTSSITTPTHSEVTTISREKQNSFSQDSPPQNTKDIISPVNNTLSVSSLSSPKDTTNQIKSDDDSDDSFFMGVQTNNKQISNNDDDDDF
ncbi:hypothetical protein WA158_006404 [Blastocystis sp. Blastoise]